MWNWHEFGGDAIQLSIDALRSMPGWVCQVGPRAGARAELLGTGRERLAVLAVVCLLGSTTTPGATESISREYGLGGMQSD